MHLSPFLGKSPFTQFFLALALLVSLGVATLLSGHAFAQANNAPEFSAQTATRSVDENTSAYTNIGSPLTATDDESDDLVYSIQNGAKTHFGIDSETGQLWVGNKLDYERKSSFSVVVVATDPSGDSDSISVTINVIDVEESGKVTPDWRRTQVGTEVTATLSDPDGSVSGVTWQWSSSDSKTGTFSDISDATEPSYTPTANDALKYLRATATYTDNRGSGKTASFAPAIYVRERSDSNSAPVLSPGETNGCGEDSCQTLRPYYPAGSYIYNPITANDGDTGDDYLFSISGPDASQFEIVNELTGYHGDLLTKQSLDYTANRYEVHVTATDLSGASATMKLFLTPHVPDGVVDVPVTTVKGIDTYPTTKSLQLDYYENGTWLVADLDSARRGGAQLAAWKIGGGDGAYFTIDSDGILNFIKPPDFDAPSDKDGNSGYTFRVYPDTGLTHEDSHIDITVRVLDVSDGASVQGPDLVSLEENSGDAIGTYTSPGSQTLALSGADADDFRLDNNGELTFINPPNYEVPTDSDGDNVYEVFVGVTPEDPNVKARCVLVTVTDVIEGVAISGKASPIDHYENDSNAVGRLAAFDAQGGSFVWTISGIDRDHFRLDESGSNNENADLYFDPTPDYETPKDDDGDNHYEITLIVTASGNNSTRVLEINVVDVNEPPTIIGESTIDYVEGSALDVEDYNATDPENDAITWSLKDIDDDDELSIDSQTGVLNFDSVPDYEDSNNPDHQYLVTVVATDSASNATELEVTINITDVNEPPVITHKGNTGSQTIQFAENNTSGVATFVATDQDSNTITWTKSGDDAALFTISNAGMLKFISPPDYEDERDQDADNDYEVTIEASDSVNDAEMVVTVRVVDIDEDPVVTGDTGPSVVEGSTDSIATYTAEDPEGENTSWETPTGDDGNKFEISSSGELSFKAAPDFETPGSAAGTNVYQVKVNASDGVNTGSLDVTVTVTGENETIVREGTWTASRNYPENSTDTVATYKATDPEGETVQWDLEGNDDDKLSISQAGVLTFNTIPDFEDKKDHNTDNVYEVTVVASDGVNAETQAVRITITNVNEAPALTVVEEVTFAEGGSGTVVTFEVADQDANTTITWSLSGDDAGDFNAITKPANEPMKGQLTFKNPPDRENAADANTDNEYEITVKATDEGGKFDEMDVTIIVSDEDETPMISGPTEFDYLENSHNTAATYHAADPEDDDIEWQLLGDDKDLFALNPLYAGASSADLIFRSSPDFETRKDSDTNNVYEMTIQATDGNPNHVQTLDVSITVTDVNETPVIDTITIDDYEENGTGDVADFSATDPDAGDTVKWSLSGDDDAYFEIDESTGVLTFLEPPDYEHEVDGSQKYTFDITVQASDDEFTDSLSVTITVTDVDEDPVISGETDEDTADPNFSYEENNSAPVHRFSAKDPEGTAITWDLEGVDEALFSITGGVLEFLSPPDFEDAKDSGANNVHNITVKVTDNTEQSVTLSVTVTVINVNEDPKFSSETSTVSVDENTPASRNIGSPFKATDEDAANRLTYVLGGTDKDSFNFTQSHSNGIQLRTKDALDYETKSSYSVTILVRDGVDDVGDPNITADDTMDITISVNNVDESGVVTFSNEQPQEDQQLGASLEDDDDGVTGLTWQWATSSSRSGAWTNATGTGATSATYTPVTADVNKYLRATASYTDGQGSGKTAHGITTNRVDARPPDPQPPEFSQASVTRQVAENASIGANVGQPVRATDPERKALTYTLEGTDAASFDIVQSSGQIQTKVALDYETKQSYTVTVKATDPSNLTDTIVVTINVVDVNEPPGKVTINAVMPSPGNEKSGLMVKWSPPENDGPDISGYNLKYSPQGTNNWAEEETSNTQKELDNLLPDTEYEVMVNAENSEGGGSFSETVRGRTQAKPEADWFNLTASFASSGYSVREGSRVSIRVNLDPTADRRQSISFDAASSTGPDSDFSIPSSVEFVPGDDSITLAFTANHDSDKSNETVTVSFGASMPTKVAAGTVNSTTVTIRDDDNDPPPPPLQPTPAPTPVPTPAPRLPSPPYTIIGGGGVTGGSSDQNRPPYFEEGVRASRDVEEHTGLGVYIGEPVTAIDPDGDELTYELGGTDADAFALDSTNGQLITRATLDLESKATYEVVMTVSDGRGAVDAIEIAIDLTDVLEVPIYNPATQAAGRVGPGEETTVWTPDGSAGVTFPAGSRSVYYWVRVDSSLTRCPFDAGDEEVQAALALGFYDNWGTPETSVSLVKAATIQFRMKAEDFGSAEVVREAHRLGAFTVYARDYATGEWRPVQFNFTLGDDGWITIRVAGLTSLDCFVLTTLGALFGMDEPIPEASPTPAPVPAPGATPVPTTQPEPAPEAERADLKLPLLVPQAVAEAGSVVTPTPEPGVSVETEPTPGPLLQQAQLVPETVDEEGMSVWPVLIMALGGTLLALSLWLFFRARRRPRF
ncbi:MAG: cadherin domain-containing protein [Chloroflexota bacterium]|nr:cadherin domain-containing protein [Chloroflexota bacterium]